MRLPPRIDGFGLSSGCQTPPAFLGTELSIHVGESEECPGDLCNFLRFQLRSVAGSGQLIRYSLLRTRALLIPFRARVAIQQAME